MTSRQSQIVFVLLCALSLTTGWRALADTFALAWVDDQYTHILLVLPITAALIYLDWHALRPMAAPNLRAGSVLLVTALVIAAVVKWSSASLPSDTQLSINTLALV